MSALAARTMVEEAPSAPVETKVDNVLIHVRYTPSAEIFFIDARPNHLAARDWLNLLLDKAPDCYQVLAGGRGFFRIPRARFDAIKA